MANERCKDCSHGSFLGGPDPLSDWCDSCQSEPNTGWGGTTDNSSIETDEYGDSNYW